MKTHFDITADASSAIEQAKKTTESMRELSKELATMDSETRNMFSTPEKFAAAYRQAIKDSIDELEGLKKEYEDLAKAQEDAARSGNTHAVETLGKAMESVAEDILRAKNAIDADRATLALFGEELEGAADSAQSLDVSSKGLNSAIQLLPAPLKGVATYLKNLVTAAKAFLATPIGAILAGVAVALKGVSTWLNNTAKGGEVLKKLSDWFEKLSIAVTGTSKRMKQLEEAVRTGAASQVASLFKLQTQWQKANGDLEKQKKILASKEWSNLGLAVNSVNDAERILISQSDNVVKAFIKRAQASAFYKEAEKEAEKWLRQYQKLDKKKSDNYADASIYEARAARLEAAPTWDAGKKAENEAEAARLRQKAKALREEADAIDPAMNAYNETIKKYNELGAEFEAAASALLSDSGIPEIPDKDLEAYKAKIQQFAELRRQQKLEAEKLSRDNAFAQRQAEIDALDEGSKKVREQMQLNFDKEKASIDDWYNGLREEKIKKAKEAFEANPANEGKAFTYNPNNSIFDATDEEQKIYEAKLIAALAQFTRDVQDIDNEEAKNYGTRSERYKALEAELKKQLDTVSEAYKERARLMNEYTLADQYEKDIAEFGSYEQKKEALIKKWTAKIALLETDAERANAAKQRDNELNALEAQYSDTYARIFADMDGMTSQMIRSTINLAEDELQRLSQVGQATTEQYAALRDRIEELKRLEQSQTFKTYGSSFADVLKLTQQRDNLASRRDSLTRQRDAIISSALANSGGTAGGFVKALLASGQDFSKVTRQIEETDDAINQLDSDIKRTGFAAWAAESATAFVKLGGALESFRDDLGGTNDTIADFGAALSGLGDGMGNLVSVLTAPEINKVELAKGAFDGIVQIISMIGKSIANNAKAQAEWNSLVAQCAHEYDMLQLKELDYKQSNIFGVENPYKRATEGIKQYGAAMDLLRKKAAELGGGQVQTGTKKAIDWGNVGTGVGAGAAIGAAAGSFIPVIGNALGAAIGAVLGGIIGAVSTKTVPVFEDLLSKYEWIYNDETYELNPAIIADYEKLDDETKQIVDNWQEIADTAREAQEQMRENLKDLAGNIGDDLSDALIDAFRNGDLNSAIDAFHKKMSSTIQDIMHQIAFSAAFGQMFDQLQADMEASFGEGGDGSITDDLERFDKTWKEGLSTYQEYMEALDQWLKDNGMDSFVGVSDTQNATAGGFQTMSQDTATELNGRFTALQIAGELVALNSSRQVELLTESQSLLLGDSRMIEEIRSAHILEAGYLEDIAKQTKPLLEFGDKLDRIERNTSKL